MGTKDSSHEGTGSGYRPLRSGALGQKLRQERPSRGCGSGDRINHRGPWVNLAGSREHATSMKSERENSTYCLRNLIFSGSAKRHRWKWKPQAIICEGARCESVLDCGSGDSKGGGNISGLALRAQKECKKYAEMIQQWTPSSWESHISKSHQRWA